MRAFRPSRSPQEGSILYRPVTISQDRRSTGDPQALLLETERETGYKNAVV